jgi:phospholipase/lecithinase/hemolysin
MSTANLAITAVVIVILTEHLAIWSLFWKRGWRVMSPAAPKATTNSVAGAADEAPASATVSRPTIRSAAG